MRFVLKSLHPLRSGKRVSRALGAACIASIVLCGPAIAEDDFYKGKTISIVVGFGPGGGYDLYARLLAATMGKHIPGQPRIIVQNMEGAGSVRAANYVYVQAPKDGTVIASVVQDTATFYLLGQSGLQYDPSRFNWLGGVVASNSTLYTWHATGVTRWEQAKTQEVILGTTGTTAGSSLVPRAMNALLGTKLKLVPGYSGTKAIHLALERGEMMGAQSTWAGLQSGDPEWIAKKLINPLVQTGPRKEPDLPNVPLLKELPETDEGKQIAAVVSLAAGIGYAHWVAPGVPADRIAMLRKAYTAAVQDPEFLAGAERQRLLVRPKTGEEVTELVRQAAAVPKPVLEETARMLGTK
jgi:tripartite-type tricarboxylate transporter receptor subunit TctC